MKIKIRTYLFMILMILTTLFLVYQEDLLHIPMPTVPGSYPTIVKIQKYIKMFCCALFSLLCFFWINTEFRYDDRATVYKKNLKYIVPYVTVFAVLFTVCITLDWLRFNPMLYLAVFLIGLIFTVLGIEAAMSFNRKHPPKFVSKETILMRCVCCVAVIMPILIYFGTFSKFNFYYMDYGADIIVFYFHCVLVVSFYKIARKLYSNGNDRVVLTCLPLILIVYFVYTIGNWDLEFVAFTDFTSIGKSIGKSIASPFPNLLSFYAYLCIMLLIILLVGIIEILLCFIGIWLAKSVHKKEKREKGIEEAPLEEQESSNA